MFRKRVWDMEDDIMRSLSTVLDKKKVTLFAIGAAIVVALVFMNITKAKGDNAKVHEHKYLISYYVEDGDTLTSIAEKYMTEEYSDVSEYVKEVKSINNLGTDVIYHGNYLIIPYYTDEELEF